MRKLAPAILFASITALIGGPALAATGDIDSPSTDNKVTVPANTSNPQGLSYTDKSNTSPGTNAKMDTPTADATTQSRGQAGVAMDNPDNTTSTKAPKHKARKAKVVKDGDMSQGDMSKTDSAPIESSNGAAVSSTTGTSGGR